MEGGGGGWISELCVVEELRSGRLVELTTAGLAPERPLYILKMRGRHFGRSVLAFLEDFE
jgi:hypothetical protein